MATSKKEKTQKEKAIQILEGLNENDSYDSILKRIKSTDNQSIKSKAIQEIKKLDSSATYEDILKAIEKANTGSVWQNTVGRWFFVCSFLFSLFSLLILLDIIPMLEDWKYTWITDKGPKSLKLIHGVVYGIWLIVPPVWFLFEYVWLFDDYLKLEPKSHADFKFTQELASKFWAALVVLFGLILYVKYGNKL